MKGPGARESPPAISIFYAMLKLAERFPPMQGEEVFAITQNTLLLQRRLRASQRLVKLLQLAGHRDAPGVDDPEPSELLSSPGDDGGIAAAGPLRQVCDQTLALREKVYNFGRGGQISIY